MMNRLFLIPLAVCFLLTSCRGVDAPTVEQHEPTARGWEELTGTYFCEGQVKYTSTESVHSDIYQISRTVEVKNRIELKNGNVSYGLVHSLSSGGPIKHHLGENHATEDITFFTGGLKDGLAFSSRLVFPAGQDSMLITMQQRISYSSTQNKNCRCGKIN